MFLDYILGNDKFLFSVRNDGSKKILRRYFSTSKLDRVYVVPDGGFFVNGGEFKHIEVIEEKINIGINIAGDMKDIRFGKEYIGFCENFGQYINSILSNDDTINIVFIPHMYLDVQIISKVMEFTKDEYRRTKISVAPLLNGTLNGGGYIFSLYKKMDLILGMRFHSNVCSIGQGIPNIGLVTYHKHGYLFDEIDLSDRALYVDSPDFFGELLTKTIDDLGQLEQIKDRYKLVNKELSSNVDEFHKIIADFLNSNGKFI